MSIRSDILISMVYKDGTSFNSLAKSHHQAKQLLSFFHYSVILSSNLNKGPVQICTLHSLLWLRPCQFLLLFFLLLLELPPIREVSY